MSAISISKIEPPSYAESFQIIPGFTTRSNPEKLAMKSQTILLLTAQIVSTIAAAPNDTSFISFTYNGSGCSNGTLTPVSSSSATTSTEISTMAFTISNFTGQTGSSRSAARRNCRVNLKMKYPAIWHYALNNIKYTGQIDIPTGNVEQISSLDYFSGQSSQHVGLLLLSRRCVQSDCGYRALQRRLWD